MKINRFDAVLFDLDDTLIDSAADIAASANYVRAQMKLPPLPEEMIRTYIGDGVQTLMKKNIKHSRIFDSYGMCQSNFYEFDLK